MNIYDKCLTIRSVSDMIRKPSKKTPGAAKAVVAGEDEKAHDTSENAVAAVKATRQP